MKLHLNEQSELNIFTGYGESYLRINNRHYTNNLIVTPHDILTWEVHSFSTLQADHFELLLPLRPEIVLFGSGPILRFPAPQLIYPLNNAKISIEVMDTRAACRTYNILLAEGRRVLAAVLLP